MACRRLAIYFSFLFTVSSTYTEEGTRAKTMRNQTQRQEKRNTSQPQPAAQTYPDRTDYNRPPESRPLPSGYSDHSNSRKDDLPIKEANHDTPCKHCISEESDEVLDHQARYELEIKKKGNQTKKLSVNSKFALTNWNFHFSPALQYQSAYFPTFEMDLNYLGFDFSYMTTLSPQPADLFKDLSLIGDTNNTRQSAMEYLRLGAMPLVFFENPLLKNLLTVDFRKTTKSTTVVANQSLYYFPYETYPGLTLQDSDLGNIFYEQKAAGSRLAYNIAERDWLIAVGFLALRIGYFDLNYAKPYQMDAEIYQGNVLVDRRVYLFEGQATGRGLMVGLQNLYFPTWDTKRFYSTSQDLLANGFFWGLRELGLYWGTGTIRLQNGIDLIEKYQAFYAGETGREPSVTFLRQIFHGVVGYKISNTFRIFLEYRYANYSLALQDRYEDAAYNYFLNHAINRDTLQQLAINITISF